MIRVVGTAGHVDHGKSALVEALTGTHPDRLEEERRREMTIDLGFAWATLEAGIEVGFIDVPGHRDFIDNMLAGVGGFDAALLVVAADEGVMPQTREHLAILDLLEIPRALVALTKIDLVADPEWADLVEEDVRRELRSTRLAQAKLVRVSARTGEGVDGLRRALANLLGESPAPLDVGRPRLPVDRSFVMTGFGAVLTGTLLDGSLAEGDEVEIQPSGLRGRVRGLQTHRRAVTRAVPGSRVAVNVSGVDAGRVARGEVLCLAGTLAPTRRLDVEVRVLPDAPTALEDSRMAKLHVGAADVVTRLRVLGADRIEPGETGWLQLVTDRPVVVVEGDRFILRRPTPGATLGGGQVVDPHPRRLYRRKDPRVVEALHARRHGTAADRLLAVLSEAGPVPEAEARALLDQAGSGPEDPLAEAVASGRARAIGSTSPGAQRRLFVEQASWESLRSRAAALLDEYHQANPLRLGMPREELRSRLGLEARRMDRVLAGLAAEGVVEIDGSRVARSGVAPRLTPEDERNLKDLAQRFRSAPFAPPSIRECREAIGDELWALQVARGAYVEVSQDVVFDRETYLGLLREVHETLSRGGVITVAVVRDRYSTSRKYALALLEHLDQMGATQRVGDERRLRPGWEPPHHEGPPSG